MAGRMHEVFQELHIEGIVLTSDIILRAIQCQEH
jgi:hypothetical protein